MSGPFARAPATVTPDKDLAANQRLRGRSLTLARIAWIAVAALTLSLFIVGIPAEFAQYHTACAPTECANRQLSQEDFRALQGFGLSLGTYAAYAVVIDIIFAAVYGAVAALIFWRRPDDRMALLVSIALLTFGIATFPDTMSVLAARSFAWQVPVAFLRSLGAITFGIFLYIFPDGRFVPTWTRWVALVWLVWQLPKHWSPEWIASNSTAWTIWLALAIWFVALGSIVYAQLHRYRHASNAVQRQQIKWVAFGISTAIAGFLGTTLVLIAFVPEPASAGQLLAHLGGHLVMVGGLLLIPLSIGVAILRFHLFDIDLIINRALVYGALTTSVVGLYVLVVGGLGTVLQVQGSLIVSLIATGLAAVMFQPLRDRLQHGVNRLIYGERDDPYAVLSRMGSRLESTLAPDAVLPTVTRTLREALKLPYAEIQLRRKEGFETAAVAGDPGEYALHLPLLYGGETVGRLVLGPRAGDGGFTTAERRLLEDLAHQIGASAHAALMSDEALRLSADLQRSRERLIEAREEERRRLRRDLHDGLGPQLSSQALTVDAALALMRQDPDAAEELLLELKTDAQDAVTDIRRLVYGLRPPALDDLGLLGALRESAAQYSAKGLCVSVEAPANLPPLSAAVEAAVYRIAQEALTNVARHAGASACTVYLAVESAGLLCVEISDDGRGMPEPQENSSVGIGVGLTSMRERASELGGSLLVEPLREGGTRVRARLPLPKEE